MRSVLALVLLLHAGSAWAHSYPQTSTPAAGSTVQQAPKSVVIGFTEAVEPHFSTITVEDTAGNRVDDGHLQAGDDGRRLAVGLKPLAPGNYRVIWHATSVDTHKTDGSFGFTVGP